MYKIVAFEGLPASGKSTLISKCKELMAGKPQPLWVDRFFYSAMVYDTLEGRDRSMEMFDFCRYVSQWDTTIVFIDTPIDWILNRETLRNKWKKYTKEELFQIQSLYSTFLKMFPLPIIILDGTKDAETLAKELIERLKL